VNIPADNASLTVAFNILEFNIPTWTRTVDSVQEIPSRNIFCAHFSRRSEKDRVQSLSLLTTRPRYLTPD
jgi:hypothetical protein